MQTLRAVVHKFRVWKKKGLMSLFLRPRTLFLFDASTGACLRKDARLISPLAGVATHRIHPNGCDAGFLTGPITLFNGDLAFFNSTGKESLVFSNDGLLLRAYVSRHDFNRAIKLRSYWGGRIPVISLKRVSKLKKYTIEPLIDSTPFDANEAVSQIFHDFEEHLKIIGPSDRKFITVDDLHPVFKLLEESGRFGVRNQLVQFLKFAPLFRCMTHGDLHRNNLVRNGREFLFIDFELSGYRLFFFDPLFFLFSEMSHDNNSPMINYFSGLYDGQIRSLFASAGLRYDPDTKLVLMYLVAYERSLSFSLSGLLERWEKIDSLFYGETH